MLAMTTLAAALSASAQVRDMYPVVEAAAAATAAQPNIVMDVGGWRQGGPTSERFQLRFFAKDGKVYAEQFLHDVKRLVVIADGQRVWRYDPIANEYTYLAQPKTFQKTVEVVAAWSRHALQRPIRLIAQSARWLVIPKFEAEDNWVRAFQTKPVGVDDWRGTDTRFEFDNKGRLKTLSVEDRLETATGLSHTWLEAVFAYPETLDVNFTFTPPRGAKPAADLPVRIPGDGG
jgi:hypothetical protein